MLSQQGMAGCMKDWRVCNHSPPPPKQIFVDNSNIFFGAWNSRDPTSQDRTVRIDVGRLVNEVERGRDVGVRKVQ
jgi:hypothetical protein